GSIASEIESSDVLELSAIYGRLEMRVDFLLHTNFVFQIYPRHEKVASSPPVSFNHRPTSGVSWHCTSRVGQRPASSHANQICLPGHFRDQKEFRAVQSCE